MDGRNYLPSSCHLVPNAGVVRRLNSDGERGDHSAASRWAVQTNCAPQRQPLFENMRSHPPTGLSSRPEDYVAQGHVLSQRNVICRVWWMLIIKKAVPVACSCLVAEDGALSQVVLRESSRLLLQPFRS